jgi:cell division protease FtsH
MIVLLLLNALVFPELMQNQVKEVGYNEFLTMVDKGTVKDVSRDETTQTITFTTEENGKTLYYKTGIWPDDTLASKLKTAGVEFTASIPTQASPLLTFLISWILPILIFVALGRVLMKRVQNGMPAELATRSLLARPTRRSTSRRRRARRLTTSPDRTSQGSAAGDRRFLHNPGVTPTSAQSCPRARCSSALRHGENADGKGRWGEANVPFFSISGSALSKCSLAWARRRCATCFPRQSKKRLASCSRRNRHHR